MNFLHYNKLHLHTAHSWHEICSNLTLVLADAVPATTSLPHLRHLPATSSENTYSSTFLLIHFTSLLFAH